MIESDQLTAPVHKIIESSFVDGPGHRIAIFLQGCLLNCRYCHNPETRAYPSITNKNIHFLSCSDLINSIKPKATLYHGITISGGEPTLWAPFITELFRRMKNDFVGTSFTRFVDTSGYNKNISIEQLQELISVTDGFLFDIKAFNNETHTKLTGHSNQIILKNAHLISEQGKLYEVRNVLVEDFNDGDQEIVDLCNFLRQLNSYTILRMIPFRPMGVAGAWKNKKPFSARKLSHISNIASSILGESRVK